MDLSKLPAIKLPKIELPHWKLPELKLPFQKTPKLRIGDCVAEIPIVQGGMGVGISLSKLASAVANEGGIGVIAANAIGMLEPDYFKNGKEANLRALRKEIRKSRARTKGIIGVNIMVAVNDYLDLLQVCIEEKVDIVFIGAGLPIKGIPIKEIREANVKIVPIISSGRAAKLIFSMWQKKYNDIPDGVVVEGPMAGGHLGFKEEQIVDPEYKLENLVPDVINVLKDFEISFDRKIPVIAAGGIYTGKDIHKFLKMGAMGVQMATRFVATHECDADIKFKEAYLKCEKEDIVIIKSPVGLPGRAIMGPFLEKVQNGKRINFRCPWQCLASCDAEKANYCISITLNNARKGILTKGYAFAGENAYRVNNITSVKELIRSLKKDMQTAAEQYFSKLKIEYMNVSNKLRQLKEELSPILEKRIVKLKKNQMTLKEKGGEIVNQEFNALVEKIANLKKEHNKNLELLNQIKLKFKLYVSYFN